MAHRRAEPDHDPGAEAALAGTDAVEVSDRSTPNELDLVRAHGREYDAVVAGVFVRASSGSGRLDLAPSHRPAAAGPGARHRQARPADGGGVLRQPLRGGERPRRAGDAAHLRFLRPGGGGRGRGAGRRDSDRRTAADRDPEACGPLGTGSRGDGPRLDAPRPLPRRDGTRRNTRANTNGAGGCSGNHPGEGMARPARLERATSWFVARRSIQLS